MSIPTADRQVVTTPLTTAHQHSAGVLTITSDRGEAELVGPASAQAMTGYSEAELVACINAGTLPCFDPRRPWRLPIQGQ